MFITKDKYFHFNPFVGSDSYHLKVNALSCDDDVDISVVKMVMKTYYVPLPMLMPLIVNT